jgi:hypothetical protein
MKKAAHRERRDDAVCDAIDEAKIVEKLVG